MGTIAFYKQKKKEMYYMVKNDKVLVISEDSIKTIAISTFNINYISRTITIHESEFNEVFRAFITKMINFTNYTA